VRSKGFVIHRKGRKDLRNLVWLTVLKTLLSDADEKELAEELTGPG